MSSGFTDGVTILKHRILSSRNLQSSACHALLLCAVTAALAAGFARSAFSARARACTTSNAFLSRVYSSVPMASPQQALLHRPVVLLFGDSLTERSMEPAGGWGAAVAHHFARKARRVLDGLAPARGKPRQEKTAGRSYFLSSWF
jgi:hypothetical protein